MKKFDIIKINATGCDENSCSLKANTNMDVSVSIKTRVDSLRLYADAYIEKFLIKFDIPGIPRDGCQIHGAVCPWLKGAVLNITLQIQLPPVPFSVI